MEKYPKFRIVGDASVEVKKTAREDVERLFDNHYAHLSESVVARLKEFERPKSEQELVLIDFANMETNRLMQEIGVGPHDIPRENFHIVSQEFNEDEAKIGTNAYADTELQAIFYISKPSEQDNLLKFGSAMIHEVMHLKGHYAMRIQQNGEEINKKDFRTGVMVHSVQNSQLHNKEESYFSGLEEAIVTTQEKKIFKKLLSLPFFEKEKERLASQEVQEKNKKISIKYEVPEDEIFWIDNVPKIYPYSKQRRVLEYVCEQIKEEFSRKYQNFDDVFKEFLRAQFTGYLLPIARLVEKTFGEGSFRLLGEMGADRESGTPYFELLKKAREEYKVLKKLLDS